MHSEIAYFICCLLICRICAITDDSIRESEPKCHSRFDYDLKVVENIASLKMAEKDLRDTVATLQKTVNTLQETIRETPRTAAFMAQLSSDMLIEPLGEVQRAIVFDQVSVNVGNAYNKYTGVFTAPYKASYHFSIDISSPHSPGGHSLHIHLLRNRQKIGYVFLDHHTQYWLRRTTAVTVQLNVGDVVQAVVVKSSGSKTNIVAGCCFHSLFSGFLIGPD